VDIEISYPDRWIAGIHETGIKRQIQQWSFAMADGAEDQMVWPVEVVYNTPVSNRDMEWPQ
jgi:hypothetical protein